MAKIDYAPLVPEAAVRFLKNKGYKIGFNWTDVWKREHQIAFTVAKAMKIDLLQDIKQSLEEFRFSSGRKTFVRFCNKKAGGAKRR